MSSSSSSLPFSSSSDRTGNLPLSVRLQYVLSARKLRIVFIVGGFFLLVGIFIRFDEHIVRLPSQFRPFTKHNASSAKEPAWCPSSVAGDNIVWSDFAYVQYVTNSNYLCNSLIIFEALRRHGTKEDPLMMYPQEWSVPQDVLDDDAPPVDYEGGLLAQARDKYHVHLNPIQVKTYVDGNDAMWQDSYTKLLAWNQTQYKRVISLDSDATLLNHMDELFLLPAAPVAMPRVCWLEQFFLSSQLIVIEPSEDSWQRVQSAMEQHESHDYDMDILNKVFGASTLVIPHRRYDLLTGEFRSDVDKHEAYLGSPTETWNARDALAEAKFVHFFDWPLPKPWLSATEEQTSKQQPSCRSVSEGETDCTDREVWLELRKDFFERRLRICGHAYDNV
ncbi:hypothetical protein ACET3X_002022 [Alternaria dauci]|uniref:Uncharacterized protein n=1 Tax=Alternaria dauci TaxID=48095 RepID=A0ABR3UZU6_9PLEO